MIRVLHLLSQTPDFQTERESAALAHGCGSGFSVTSRTIGRGGDYRNGLFAALALRRKVAAEFDVVHAWDSRALDVIVQTGAVNIVYTPGGFPGPGRLESVRLILRRRNVHLVCASELEHAAYLGAGFPSDRCHFNPSGIDLARLKPGRDPALRTALGFDERDIVFLALGESTRPAGHRDVLWAVSILHVLYPHWKILLWGRGDEVDPCNRLAAKLFQPNLLTIAERKLGRRVEFAELLPAADVVLSAPFGQTPVLPLAMCMAAGLPIISTASLWTDDLLRDGKNAALVPRRSARMLAQRAIEVLNNSELRSAIGATARREAVRLFPLNKFVARYRTLYHNVGDPNRRALERTITILRAVDPRIV